jgi:hypothetical protein
MFDPESGELFVGIDRKVTSITSVQTRTAEVYKDVAYTKFLILTREFICPIEKTEG